MVAQSASRALGLLIAQYKSMGGMSYRVYSKLYDSMVWSVIAYMAAVWGDKRFHALTQFIIELWDSLWVLVNMHPLPLSLGIWAGNNPKLANGWLSVGNCND